MEIIEFMDSDKLSKIIEILSIDYVLADVSSNDDIETLLKSIDEIIVQAHKLSYSKLKIEAEKGLTALTDFFQKKTDEQIKKFESVEQIIKQIQIIFRDYQFVSNSTNSLETKVLEQPVHNNNKNKNKKGLIHPAVLPEYLDNELYGQFLSIQKDILEKMEAIVLEIEQTSNTKMLQDLKRYFHTLKGEAGSFNLEDVEIICHKIEDIIEGENFLSYTDIVFASIDWLRDIFNYYSGLADFTVPVTPLLEEIKKIDNCKNILSVNEQKNISKTIDEQQLIVSDDKIVLDDKKGSLKKETKISSDRIRETINVDSERLDRIVDMIGELLIAESLVVESKAVKQIKSPTLQKDISRLNKIIRELQMTTLSIRMLPIKALFNKMGRVIRDLSKKVKMPIIFSFKGEDTELDKSIVDKLGDPLIHLIRNAVDHGIEDSIQDRLDAGKSKEGHIELRAFHKGGNIVIEIEDDGRGLNRKKILEKAVKNNLIPEGTTLNDDEILNLIFNTGLSTADKLTQISGRGVGMNVVKASVESLRGYVDIKSEKNKGTTFIIQLPLTLAVIDGMIVLSNNNRYIIPVLSIVTSNKLEINDLSNVLGQEKMVKVQDELVPLFDIDFLLNDNFSAHKITINSEINQVYIVVESGQQKVALLIDKILGKQHIVVKSLGPSLKNIPGITGGAILSDGMIGLIIDVESLLKKVS